jgi:hypothetical protein
MWHHALQQIDTNVLEKPAAFIFYPEPASSEMLVSNYQSTRHHVGSEVLREMVTKTCSPEFSVDFRLTTWSQKMLITVSPLWTSSLIWFHCVLLRGIWGVTAAKITVMVELWHHIVSRAVINILEEPSTRTWQLPTKLHGVINDYVRGSRSLLILLSFTMFEEAKG